MLGDLAVVLRVLSNGELESEAERRDKAPAIGVSSHSRGYALTQHPTLQYPCWLRLSFPKSGDVDRHSWAEWSEES